MPKDDHVLELEFEKGKDTKNKSRYEELVVGEDTPVVGSLYIIKGEAAKFGDKLVVTIANA